MERPLTGCRHSPLNDRNGRKAERPLSGYGSVTLLWHVKLYISVKFQPIVSFQLRYIISNSASEYHINKNVDAIAAKVAY